MSAAPAGAALPPGFVLPTATNVAGGYLISSSISILLYGIGIAQAYVYALRASEDSLLMKSVVALVCILETVHTALTLHVTYFYLIVNFNNVLMMDHIVWSAAAAAMSITFGVAVVQAYYIRRIWILSQHAVIVTGLTALMVVASLVFGITTVALLFKQTSWTAFHENFLANLVISLSLATIAAGDIMIALILMYYLYKNQTGYKRTDHVIHALMAYVVNTGALTAAFCILILVTYVLAKKSLLFIGIYAIGSKLYMNSLLGLLNSRDQLRNRTKGPSTFEAMQLSQPHIRSGHASFAPRQHIEIFTEVSNVINSDIERDVKPKKLSPTSADEYSFTAN